MSIRSVGFVWFAVVAVALGACSDSSGSSGPDRQLTFRKYWNTVADTAKACQVGMVFANVAADSNDSSSAFAMLHRVSDCGDRMGRYASATDGDDDLDYVAQPLAQGGWDLRDGAKQLYTRVSAGETDLTDARSLLERSRDEMATATQRMKAKYAKVGGDPRDIKSLTD